MCLLKEFAFLTPHHKYCHGGTITSSNCSLATRVMKPPLKKMKASQSVLLLITKSTCRAKVFVFAQRAVTPGSGGALLGRAGRPGDKWVPCVRSATLKHCNIDSVLRSASPCGWRCSHRCHASVLKLVLTYECRGGKPWSVSDGVDGGDLFCYVAPRSHLCS